MQPANAGAAPEPGGRSNGARRNLWVMLRHGSTVTMATHTLFLVLFAILGLPLLVWTNVLCVLMSAGSRALLSMRRNSIGVGLLLGTIVLHAVVASWLLGWDGGFHGYLLAIVAPLTVAMAGTVGSKLVRLAVFGACYMVLDAWTRRTTPYYPLPVPLLDTLRYVNLAGMLAVMAFVSLTYYQLVITAERALHALASTDPLTRLLNRRRLLEIVRATRTASPAAPCVLICDIDHFKHVNDRYGHDMGDLVLQRVAAAIAASVRTGDSVARWGGEEFVVLLPEAQLDAAMEMGERLRNAVAGLLFEAPPLQTADTTNGAVRDATLRVSLTIGVGRVGPDESIEAAVARADAALYRGKTAGRNRVVAAEQAVPGPSVRAA